MNEKVSVPHRYMHRMEKDLVEIKKQIDELTFRLVVMGDENNSYFKV